jgi:hypothetical protein
MDGSWGVKHVLTSHSGAGKAKVLRIVNCIVQCFDQWATTQPLGKLEEIVNSYLSCGQSGASSLPDPVPKEFRERLRGKFRKIIFTVSETHVCRYKIRFVVGKLWYAHAPLLTTHTHAEYEWALELTILLRLKTAGFWAREKFDVIFTGFFYCEI